MELKEVVHTRVEAFNRADVERLASLYDEHAVNYQVAECQVEGCATLLDRTVR
jgi:ketosteroid isomerase-like protein